LAFRLTSLAAVRQADPEVIMYYFIYRILFNSTVRKNTWRKLAALFTHKIPERHALVLLRDRYAAKKSSLAKIFTEVIAEIDRGYSLDVAFANWIPNEEFMLIRAGIKDNRLPQALYDCVELIDSGAKIKGAIKSAFLYPLLLIGLLIALLLCLAFFALPELAQLSNPEQWTGAASVLYSVCMFVASPMGLISFILLIGVIAAAIISMPLWTGKMRLYVEQTPPWSIYRLMVASTWLFSLATMLRAGIALDVIVADMLNSEKLKPWLRERLSKIQDGMGKEGNFGILLQHLNMRFPDPELVEELSIYAALPRFEENLYFISKEWLAEGVTLILKQADLIKGVLLLVIVGVLCLFGISVGSINDQLTQSMGGMG
jgi:type II secretory pathway component PulF